ncbi:iron-sulfur cluster biosynthesis family protein [Paenibacillus sp. S150]|uniref:iron-sulfur cluster biosynthesis family protein n=1 Tax=Paenibacillus sp. S150 TaxID=2749826 RepID=UPI001C56390A|nr:iron-sulfur cluster biosynthesis family protein [Paenibacillus sp. S150]MBW4081357.1 iron-sulfur cluster biosynthesis family protein [Paenibacillus sp. S150]
MKIQITPLAESKLQASLKERPGLFKLFFDTEGCGCDGIHVLLIVHEADAGDAAIETDGLPFVISRQQEIFYEDNMRLDADERISSFKLDSNSQIYSRNILVRDVRSTDIPQPAAGTLCDI